MHKVDNVNQGNNDFQDYGQGFGGSQSGQNTSYNNNNRASNNNQSDNPFANEWSN